MFNFDSFRRDLASITGDLPILFIRVGQDRVVYTGTPDMLSSADNLEPGGFAETDSKAFSVPVYTMAAGTFATAGYIYGAATKAVATPFEPGDLLSTGTATGNEFTSTGTWVLIEVDLSPDENLYILRMRSL